MLRSTTTESTLARLTLAVGSRAGTEAPLQFGYYMIGRCKECQIRPKSRSVSRRHCLLYHGELGLKLMDIGSTSGTSVNDKKLPPKQWAQLDHGDLIRCGKVVFSVGLEASSAAGADRQTPANSNMVSGDAWQEADVAEFLGAEDDADRARRYDSIRARNQTGHEESIGNASGEEAVSSESGEFDTIEFPEFSDDAFSVVADEPLEKVDADPPRQSAASKSKKQTATKRKPKPPQPPRLRKPKASARKRSPRFVLPSFSPNHVETGELLKLVGTVVLVIATTGLLGWNGYKAYTGPNVRVIHGID